MSDFFSLKPKKRHCLLSTAYVTWPEPQIGTNQCCSDYSLQLKLMTFHYLH